MVVMGKFDPLRALKYVHRYGITFIVGVPTVLEELADKQEQGGYDLSTLKGIVTMGSPLERAACIRYQRVLTPNIYNGYGTTETLWNTFLRPFDLPDNAGSAGRSCVLPSGSRRPLLPDFFGGKFSPKRTAADLLLSRLPKKRYDGKGTDH